jgi:peptidoglycan/LPS O-acetylase OafA/YrhL
MPENARRYIPTLDGWRAVAIILVLFCHDAVHRLGPLSTSWLNEHGGVGVDVFFAISGILICTLLLDEEEQTGRISLKQFYVRRAFRILPAALVYLLCLALLAFFGVIALRKTDWLASLFFFRNYTTNDPVTWYTAHFWSLSVEEHFYLLLPGFLVLCLRFRARILLLAGAGLSIAFVLAKRNPHTANLPFLDFSDFRLAALFVPAAVAVALRRVSIRQWSTKFLQPAPMILLVAAAIVANHFLTLVLPFLLPAMVVGTTLHPGAMVSAVLESKPLRFIGKRSYSLYLWQQLFMTAHYRPGILDLYLQRWPLSVLSAFACACLSYSFVEKPLIELGRRVVQRRTAPAKESVAA